MTVPGHRLTRLVYIILSLSNRINYGTWRFTYTSMILVHSHEIKSNYMYNQIKSCLNIVAIHHRTWVIGLFDLDCCRHGNVFHLSDQCCMCSAMVSTYMLISTLLYYMSNAECRFNERHSCFKGIFSCLKAFAFKL